MSERSGISRLRGGDGGSKVLSLINTHTNAPAPAHITGTRLTEEDSIDEMVTAMERLLEIRSRGATVSTTAATAAPLPGRIQRSEAPETHEYSIL